MAGCQQIVTMCMSPAEETLAISTDRGQMYHLSLSSIDMKKVLLYTAAQKKIQSLFYETEREVSQNVLGWLGTWSYACQFVYLFV